MRYSIIINIRLHNAKITFPTLHIMSLPVGVLRMSVVRSSSKLSQTDAPASLWNVKNYFLCDNIINFLIYRYTF